MQFRGYPVIISRKNDGSYYAFVPDLQAGTEIYGFDSIVDVCGLSMAFVLMYCDYLKTTGVTLPEATPINEAKQNRPDGFIMCIRVIVAQAEEGDKL